MSPAPGTALMNKDPADLDSEIDWLLKVTAHFVRCRKDVAEILSPQHIPIGEHQ